MFYFCLFASYPPRFWKTNLTSNTEIYYLGLSSEHTDDPGKYKDSSINNYILDLYCVTQS